MRSTRSLGLPLAALIGLLALPSLVVAETSITPEEFLGRVDRAIALARLDGAPPSAERMSAIRTALGLPVEITFGEWTTSVPRDPVIEPLAGASVDDFDRAQLRLRSLARMTADTASRQPHTDSELATALDAAYRGVVPPRPDPFTLVLQTFEEAIQAITARIGEAVGRVGDALAWLILIGIVVLAGYALLRSDLVPDRRVRSGRLPGDTAQAVDWVGRGEAALRVGDLHEAVRAFYVALLVVLAARGIVADAPALTAGEARIAVRRSRPELFPAIARATDTYERVVYGGATPGEGDVQGLRDAAAQVRKR